MLVDVCVFIFKQKEGKEPFQLDLAVWREGEVTRGLFMPGFQYKRRISNQGILGG